MAQNTAPCFNPWKDFKMTNAELQSIIDLIKTKTDMRKAYRDYVEQLEELIIQNPTNYETRK